MTQGVLTDEQARYVITQQHSICMDAEHQMSQLEQLRQCWRQDEQPVDPEIAHLFERLIHEEALRVHERHQQAESLLSYAQYCLAIQQQQVATRKDS